MITFTSSRQFTPADALHADPAGPIQTMKFELPLVNVPTIRTVVTESGIVKTVLPVPAIVNSIDGAVGDEDDPQAVRLPMSASRVMRRRTLTVNLSVTPCAGPSVFGA